MKKFLRVFFIMTLLITSFGAVNVKADHTSCTYEFDFNSEKGCKTPVKAYLDFEEGTGKASFRTGENDCGITINASESDLKSFETSFSKSGRECPEIQANPNGDSYSAIIPQSVDITLGAVRGTLTHKGFSGTIPKEEESSIPEGNVGDNFCSQKEVKQVLKFFGIIILLLKFAVPLIIIVKGTFLFYNAVVKGGDDDITKNAKELGIKIFIGVLIFFLPGIIKGILNLYNDFATVESEYTDCATCLLEPGDCSLS